LHGCDSALTLHLTVTSVDTSVTVSALTLTATAAPATYQWLNCPSMSQITGQTNQSYTTIADGNYAVVVTQNGCTDTSSCYNITTVGINENSFADVVHIYPNPANDNFTIISPQSAVIEITNIQGQLIKTIAACSNKTNVDVSALQSGVYIVEVTTEKGIAVKKFIKE
jgi:Secretion system C-terminal sorting domain